MSDTTDEDDEEVAVRAAPDTSHQEKRDVVRKDRKILKGRRRVVDSGSEAEDSHREQRNEAAEMHVQSEEVREAKETGRGQRKIETAKDARKTKGGKAKGVGRVHVEAEEVKEGSDGAAPVEEDHGGRGKKRKMREAAGEEMASPAKKRPHLTPSLARRKFDTPPTGLVIGMAGAGMSCTSRLGFLCSLPFLCWVSIV